MVPNNLSLKKSYFKIFPLHIHNPDFLVINPGAHISTVLLVLTVELGDRVSGLFM